MSRAALFVYGSLLAPQVLRALLDRAPALQPARLQDYRRSALRGQIFPGLVPAAGAVTPGALIDVRPCELRRLDAWEDDFFCRRPVDIRLTDGIRVRAQAYLLAPRHRHLLAARAWMSADFERRHAAACTSRIRRWRRDRGTGLRHTGVQSPLNNDKALGKQPGHA